MADVQPLQPRGGPRAAAGRDRLLLVAMRLIAERGYDSVTVRDISTEAGVSVGLINHHFTSKEGLRQAVDDYFIQRTGAALHRSIEATEDFDLDRIATYQRRWIMTAEPEWPHFLAYLRRAIMEANPWGEALFRRYYDSIRTLIDRMDAKGMVSPQSDRLWLPFLYMFIIIGPLVLDPFIRSMLGKSTYEPEMWGRFQRAAHALFWDGARTENKETPKKQ